MTFNRVQLLRNKPIKIERDSENGFLYVQGPSIGTVYEDELLYFLVQLIIMSKEELIDYLKIKNLKYSKMEIINLIFKETKDAELLSQKISEIIIDSQIEDEYLCVNGKEITDNEISLIANILKIVMGQKKYDEVVVENKELSDQEKKLAELEKKIQQKKQKQAEDKEVTEDKNVLEDIMAAVSYEFGYTIEHMMNMNYFTLLWYYSYTGKIHVYRINHFALSSGMVKKINTDYFTSLK